MRKVTWALKPHKTSTEWLIFGPDWTKISLLYLYSFCLFVCFWTLTETLVRSLAMLKRIRPGTIKLFDKVTLGTKNFFASQNVMSVGPKLKLQQEYEFFAFSVRFYPSIKRYSWFCGEQKHNFHSYDSLSSAVQLNRSVVSDSIRPHESQHTRPPCPSPTPRVHPNPRPSSR